MRNNNGVYSGSNGDGLTLYISGERACTGEVEIPGIGFADSFTVIPGQVTSVSIPTSAAMVGSGVAQPRHPRHREPAHFGLRPEPDPVHDRCVCGTPCGDTGHPIPRHGL